MTMLLSLMLPSTLSFAIGFGRRGWRRGRLAFHRRFLPLKFATVDNHNGTHGTVFLVCGNSGNFLDDIIEAPDCPAKYDVLAIEVGAWTEGDEKLGAVARGK